MVGMEMGISSVSSVDDLTKSVKGRYVRIMRNSKGCLNIADIQVISNGVNVAKGKPVNLSSPYHNLFSGNYLVDEVLDTFSQTSCEDAGHMTIDLGSDQKIDSIKVFNRKDCCQGRLLGSTVEIHDSGHTLMWSSAPFRSRDGKVTPDESNGTGNAFMVYEASPPAMSWTGSSPL